MYSFLRLILVVIILTSIRVHIGSCGPMSFEPSSLDKMPVKKPVQLFQHNYGYGLDEDEIPVVDSKTNPLPNERLTFKKLLENEIVNICVGLGVGIIVLIGFTTAISSCLPFCRDPAKSIEDDKSEVIHYTKENDCGTEAEKPCPTVKMPQIIERVVRGGDGDGTVFITVLNVPKDKLKPRTHSLD